MVKPGIVIGGGSNHEAKNAADYGCSLLTEDKKCLAVAPYFAKVPDRIPADFPESWDPCRTNVD